MSTDWEVKRLGGIASFHLGSGLSKGDLSSDGKRRCIHYGELVTTYGERITEILHGTNREDGSFQSVSNDVLMPTSGETPDVLATASCIMVDNAIIGGGILVIRASRNRLNGEFLAYVIKAHRNQILQLVSGTTVFHIYGRDMASFRFAAPNVQEQTAIVDALSDVDTSIRALDSLIDKRRFIKQAVMQQILTGKTRLPGFDGRWTPTTLGDAAEIVNGATPDSRIAAYWNGHIPWCTPTDITRTPGKYIAQTERSVTAAGLASCSARLLPVGTLLLCSRATIGQLKIAAAPICTNQGFKSLICNSGVCNDFLYYLLITMQSQLVERSIGSTFLEIGKREVASIEVRLPPYDEQRAIAAVLSDLDEEIAVLEQRRDKTSAIKHGMMQQLLTGRVRLVKPAAVAEGGNGS